MPYLPSRFLSFALVCALCAAAFGQQAPPAQDKAQVVDAEEVVRITTNLVQLDAVVTDKSGKQVTDLRLEDFEVLEDGKPQQLTNLAYISLDQHTIQTPIANVREAHVPSMTNAARGPVAPMPLRPEQVHRTIALVVDDLGLSFESMAQVRAALRKYVDEQMQPNDLVAILRTSAGMGALQQFTNDKRVLYTAIDRVKWYPLGRGGVSAFAPVAPDVIGEANRTAAALQASNGQTSPTTPQVDQTQTTPDFIRDVGNDIDIYREEIFSVGTLGALNFVVKGLRELPGRKSAILFSDGISIFKRDGKSERVLESMRRLVDLANRASVVIYTMDARGLQSLAPNAQDNFAGRNGASIRTAADERETGYFESKNGLNYLAQQTGGIFFENDNNLTGGVQRVLDDQKGFYLIGYRPDPATFDARTGRRSFHQIDVHVKRPGLKVRTRNGFYGFTDEEAKPQRTGRQQQLYGALSSPFNLGKVGVRLTSLYGHDAQTGAFMRSLIYIDGHDLTFKQQPDGTYRADVDVLALTFGDTGQPLDDYNATLTWTGDEHAYQNVLRGGLVYVANVPVKQPGPYQLRLAVRDVASERVGSANQFIEVPDLSNGHLTLSGLVISGADEARVVPTTAKQDEAATTAPAAPRAPQPLAVTDLQAGPALRRLRPGMALYYNFAIYNAQANAQTHPQLQMQARLFRDGQLIYTGQPLPIDPSGQTDPQHLLAGGRMKLGARVAPGQYVLQVTVTDARARDQKHAMTAQWLDFEIAQ
ncbi:MAG: VWA domain-containing protein [Pyrinomonadaceae bacterium]